MCRIVSVGDSDENARAVDSEPLPANPAGAENQRSAAGLSMQTYRCDDVSAKPKRRAVGLRLMADLDRGIDGGGSGPSYDRSVVEQHGCRAVMIVVIKAVANQRPARVDSCSKVSLLHSRDLTGDWPRSAGGPRFGDHLTGLAETLGSFPVAGP